MPEKKISPKDYALASSVIIIWGANFSFIKIALHEIDPFLLTFLRFFLSSIPFIFFIKRPDVPATVLVVYGLIFGFGLWGLVNMSIYTGLSPGLASILIQFSVFFTILLSYIIFGERINSLQYISCALAFIGLVLIINRSDSHGTFSGVVLALLGAVSWSICNIIVKKFKPVDMFSFVVWSSFYATMPLFLIFLFFNTRNIAVYDTNLLSNSVVISLISQSYLTTVFGYWAWNSLIKKYSATAIAPLSLMVPICAITVGVLAFGEDLPPWKFLAIILIVTGVSLFTLSERLLARMGATRA